RHAGDFRAIERLDAARGRLEPLDRLNGGLVTWPGGHAPYVYGLGFHEYLVDRFGERSLGTLATRTSAQLPFAGALAFRGVFGESLGALWHSYSANAPAAATAFPPAADGPVRLTHHGQVVVAPRFATTGGDGCQSGFAACPAEIVYTVRNPQTFPELRAIAIDGTGDRSMTTRYLGRTVGSTRDAIVLDQQEIRRNVGSYSDLYVLNPATGDVRRLTRNQRLQDPDVSRDGSAIVAVRQRRGERDLVVLRLAGPLSSAGKSEASEIDVLASEPDVQFSTPRWSPDGRLVVAERRRLGALPELIVFDTHTRHMRVLASDERARIVTPTWTPDGTRVVAAADFDNGPFDLYEFAMDGSQATRLTRSAGAFWPDVSTDGSTLVYSGYTTNGFDVFRSPYRHLEGSRALHARGPSKESAPPPSPSAQPRPRPYSPLATLPPTSWVPLVTSDAGHTRLGAAIYGADILARHLYAAELTWLVHAPSAVPVEPRSPDWNLTYAYARWRPSLFVSTRRETSFLRQADTASGAVTAALQDFEIQSGVSLPIVHARTSRQLFASVVGRQADRTLAAATESTRVVASRGAASFSTARVYGYSISPEDGVRIGSTVELARQAFGSDASATMVTADVRAYLPGLGVHHVLALRGAAGRSTGSTLAGRMFTLGGPDASPSTIDFGRGALGLLRGFSSNRFSGSQVEVINAEYRLPLVRVERGAGTWPLFLRWLHGAVFADAGRVSRGARDEGWRSSLGAEGSIDFVAGYRWPITTTVGVATTRDGATRGVAMYARVGRSF
ncbi:MAG: hypothetical protein AB7J63_15910, partial [Vicinamibacterales bacterium]